MNNSTKPMPNKILILQPSEVGASAANTSDPTDEALMARIQQRDEQALTILYRRYCKLLHSVIGRCIYDQQHAEDLLQEVFVEIWNRAEHYREEKGRALGWLITLARRRALDRVRRFQAYHRAEQRLRDQEENNPLTESHADGDAEVQSRELAHRLEEALTQLPEAQAEAVRMAFQQGLSQRDIVARTGIPLGTVKTRIELGLRKMANALKGELAAA